MTDPVSIMLAAQAALAVGGAVAGGQQSKTEKANISAGAAVAKEQSAQQSLLAAQNFRKNLGAQLAVSALRSRGGGSIARQFGAVAVSANAQDALEFERRQRFIDMQAKSGKVASSQANMARNVSGLGQLLQSATNTINFSGGETTKQTTNIADIGKF